LSTIYNGYTHKFTIFSTEPVECYLKVGLVGVDHWFKFPHLSIGDICYLDLTVSKQIEELRIYEVLFEVANKIFECGGNIKNVCSVMKSQQIFPRGSTSNKSIPICSSIVDYVAKYLEAKT